MFSSGTIGGKTGYLDSSGNVCYNGGRMSLLIVS